MSEIEKLLSEIEQAPAFWKAEENVKVLVAMLRVATRTLFDISDSIGVDSSTQKYDAGAALAEINRLATEASKESKSEL